MKRLLLVMAAMAVIGSIGARADEKKEPKYRKESFLSQRIIDKLPLTADQAAQVKTLRADFAKERDAWMDAHKAEREALRNEIEATEAAGDKAKLTELRKQWRERFKPLQTLREQYRDKLRALLTDEQKLKLEQALKEAKERRAGRD